VIAGANLFDNILTDKGKVYSYNGSPAGLSSSASWTVESVQGTSGFGYAVSAAGDVNGDGYSDVIVGALNFDLGQTNEGRAVVYYGNEKTGLKASVQQYKPFTNTVVYSGGLSGTNEQIKLNIFGRCPFGRSDGRFVYEFKPNGIPFSGSVITNSTDYSGLVFSYSDLGSTGMQLNVDLDGILTLDKEYKWRARVAFNPVNNPYQVYGPWKYYTNFVPVPFGCFKPQSYPLPPPEKTLSLTMFIQGFYNANSNVMVQDTITVYLRTANSPYSPVDSSKSIINSSGIGTFIFNNFNNISNGINYYLHLKHRNSIETWSAAGQSFTASQLTYNFSNASAQAFGNNMIQVDTSPMRFAIYNGDVDQDGVVDATDAGAIDNDASNFVVGYVNTDLTGDNVTDASDAAIADNNAFNFVIKITP
jgi:hypothetical protein